jgi:mannose-6-phosphate isomerase-like protein (cupin superfamily)
MSYTIKNLRDTKDQAPAFGLSDVGEAHFPREELSAESVGFAFHVLKPERRQAFGHRHEHAEEVYVVVAGAGRVRLDDSVLDIGELDAIRVTPEITRAFEAGPTGMTVLAFGPAQLTLNPSYNASVRRAIASHE